MWGRVPTTREAESVALGATFGSALDGEHKGCVWGQHKTATVLPQPFTLTGLCVPVAPCCFPVRCSLVIRIYLGMWLSATGV